MIFNILGFIGAGAIVIAYALLQFGRLQAQQRLYSGLNAAGAATYPHLTSGRAKLAVYRH